MKRFRTGVTELDLLRDHEMSTIYTCEAPGCRAGAVSQADSGPEFFCRTAGMNEHFRIRADGTRALDPDACSPGCHWDDCYFFHDAPCAARLAKRERARRDTAHHWDEWWQKFLEHVAAHGAGYGGSY